MYMKEKKTAVSKMYILLTEQIDSSFQPTNCVSSVKECSRILNRCMAMLTAAIECSRKLNNSMAGQTECMPQELSS